MNPSSLIDFKNVSKSFGPIEAIKQISFSVLPGTFHGIVGENGAGKSTTMNILYGLIKADSGTIHLRGRETRFHSPEEAIQIGIGMVHQHFMLVPTLTVWENIVLGMEPAFFHLDPKKTIQEIESLQEQFGFSLELSAITENLSLGEQQQIEILKLLYRKASILILDEPTAVLAPQEVSLLFEKLKFLQEQGKTIIVITHKLKEILSYTQRVTVMRSGQVITTVETQTLTEDSLSQLMMGRARIPLRKRSPQIAEQDPVLHLKTLSTESTYSRGLHNINLAVYPGQIVGIAGIEGQGQHELIEVLCQLRTFSGSARLLGELLNSRSAYSRRQSGFSLIPLDRQKQGLVMEFSNADNFILGHHREIRFQTNGFLNADLIQAQSQDLMNRFEVHPNDPHLLTKSLSGGNQQKLLIARETSSPVKFLLACHPTRGVDIGSIEFIHSHFQKLAGKGAGILLISSDLDELLSLTDSMCVIREGTLVYQGATDQLTMKDLGIWMMGAKI